MSVERTPIMAYEFTSIDGKRVEVNVAAAFYRMAADFERDTGCSLHVRDGSRTREEQQAEWDAYVARGYAPPRVAEPGTSNHEIDGPNGPRSIDIYDSCDDPGVTWAGTARDNWMRWNAGNYGFENEGYLFGEPWHKTFRGDIGGSSGGDTSLQWPARNLYGADWVVAAQQKLIKLGYDLGPDGADGYDGANTQAAVRDVQGKAGLNVDGVYGPNTNDYVDRALAEQETGVPPFPLPAGSYFGPEQGGVESVSGWHGHREDLRRWQQRMKDRGWTIDPDGLYGPQGSDSTDTETGRTALAFQKEKGYKADGLIGPETWTGAWTAPITPPNPDPDPEPDPDPNDGNYTSRPTSDIQKLVGAPVTGKWDAPTAQAVTVWQGKNRMDTDGLWGSCSDGRGFPANPQWEGIDYSFSRPSITELSSFGFKVAGRYLWNEKYADGRTNKGLSVTELAELHRNGFTVFFIYEEDGKELAGGREAGLRVAKAAEEYRVKLGLGEVPIYFNVDYDASGDDLNKIGDALRAIAEVIGLQRVGLYAGYNVLTLMFDAGLITWGFQTYAWSGGKWDSRAQIQQYCNGQWGGQVDFLRATVAEFGQNPVTAGPDPEPEPEPEPEEVEVPRAWLEKLATDIEGFLS